MTKREALDKLNAVRTACEGIVSERCDPFDGFYRGGSSAFMRYLRDTIVHANFDLKMVKRLIKIRDVMQGAASEEDDMFGGMIDGGTKTVMDNLESVMEALGVTFQKPVWTAFEYTSSSGKKEWGITGNPSDTKDESSWVLTGFSSREEAEQTINEDWFKSAAA